MRKMLFPLGVISLFAIFSCLMLGSPQWSKFIYIFQCYSLNRGVDEIPYDNEDDRVLPVPAHYTGFWLDWYKNGKLREKSEYVDGKRVGIIESFYDNGLRNSLAVCKDGKLFAYTKIWGYQGKLEIVRPLKDYLVDGYFEQYDSKEKLIHRSYYEHGVLKTYPPRSGDIPPPDFTGEWTVFYPNSDQKHQTSVYKNGTLLYPSDTYDDNGAILSKTLLSKNKRFYIRYYWTSNDYMRIETHLLGSEYSIASLLWNTKTKKISGYELDDEPLPRFDDNGAASKTGTQYPIPDRK